MGKKKNHSALYKYSNAIQGFKTMPVAYKVTKDISVGSVITIGFLVLGKYVEFAKIILGYFPRETGDIGKIFAVVQIILIIVIFGIGICGFYVIFKWINQMLN